MPEVPYDEAGTTAEVLMATGTYGGVSYGAGVVTVTVEGTPTRAVVTTRGDREGVGRVTGVGDPTAALAWLVGHGLPVGQAAGLIDFAIRTADSVGSN